MTDDDLPISYQAAVRGTPVLSSSGATIGTLEHVLGWDPVRNVDDLDFGRDPLDHAVTGAYEVVLETEVAQERHEHGA